MKFNAVKLWHVVRSVGRRGVVAVGSTGLKLPGRGSLRSMLCLAPWSVHAMRVASR
jgi:hypothetical protein